MPAVSSSSRNANSVFARIERGDSRGSLQAVAAEGSSFFIPRQVAQQLQLFPGMELDEQEYLSLRHRADGYLARRKAMDLLAMREHTRSELLQKLQKKGFAADVAEETVETLVNEQLQSDRRFGEVWLRGRLARRPAARGILAAELQRKGVGRELCEELLDEFYDEDTAERALEAAAAKLMRKRTITREGLMQGLARLGFRYTDAERIADRLFSQ